MSHDFSSLSDEELARRAKGGDAHAFDALVRRYLRPALAVALEFVDARDDAEDLVQEAFHRALRGMEHFDERLSFRPWFFTILRNVGRNLVARQRRWQSVHVPETLAAEQRSPHDDAEWGETSERLSAAIEKLPEMQRACVRLFDVEGFNTVEVAEMLGITSGTVRTHVHRARRALREILPPTGGDDRREENDEK